jgi:hypothetical protein
MAWFPAGCADNAEARGWITAMRKASDSNREQLFGRRVGLTSFFIHGAANAFAGSSGRPAPPWFDFSTPRTEMVTGELAMAERDNATAKPQVKQSWQIYEENRRLRPQLDDGLPRQSEDDQQREQFGPRGVPGQPDPARMVPQRKKKTPSDFDPGHTG